MGKRKFDDVPTAPLFDAAPFQHKPEPTKRPKAVGHADCSHCTREDVPIDRQGNHVLWREHHYETWGGTFMICRASGVALCVAAPRATDRETPRCQHD